MSTTTPLELNDPRLLKQVAELRRTDNVTNWLYLAREYLFLALVVGGTIAFYLAIETYQWSWAWAVPVTLAAIWTVGAGQHRLATLTHEAAHYMLFRNRTLNELVSEWCCMYPIWGETHGYRVQHLAHHQHPNDPERDPDLAQLEQSGHRFRFPMTRGQFLWHCVVKQLLWPPFTIRYILTRAGFTVKGEGPYQLAGKRPRFLRLFGVLYHLTLVGIAGAAVATGSWPLLFLGVGALWSILAALHATLPDRCYVDFLVKNDLPLRFRMASRATFNTLVALGLASASIATGLPFWLYYLVLWVVPLGTSFAFFMILRQVVQHGNADRGRLTNTRVFRVHPLLSASIFPIGNDDHLPHHLFPMVPHYNLRRLHELLAEVPAYRDHAEIVEGYFTPRSHPPTRPTVVDLMTK